MKVDRAERRDAQRRRTHADRKAGERRNERSKPHWLRYDRDQLRVKRRWRFTEGPPVTIPADGGGVWWRRRL